MPSTRDPVVVVQPGPGRLPANTVPANALIFPPGGSSDAALQAHITDPVGAHADSAISTLGFPGATWSDPAGSVQSAMTRVYEGVNARADWVLDADPANDADFTGPNALINAVAAIVAGTRARLYLRPGTYNWNDAVVFSSTTIIAAVSHTVSATNRTIIQNLAGDIRFGSFCIVENVTLEASGELRVVGVFGIGINSFTNIELDITGDIDIVSMGNTFQRVFGLDGAAVSGYINDVAGFTTYIDVLLSQLNLAGLLACTLTNVGVGGFNAPKYPSQPVLAVSSSGNRFTGLLIDGSSASFTGTGLSVSGDDNHFTSVQIDSLIPTVAGSHTVNITGTHNKIDGLKFSSINLSGAGATSLLSVSGEFNHVNRIESTATIGGTSPLLDVSGDESTFNTVEIVNGSVSSHVVNLTSSFNKGGNFLIDGVTVTGAFSALRLTEDGNRIEGVLLRNLSGFTEPLLLVDGDLALDPKNNTLTNLTIDTISGQADKFVWIAGIANKLQGYKLTNITTSTSAAPALVLSGSAHTVHNMYMADSTFAAPVIEFLNADESTVEGVRIEDLDVSTTFRIVHFTASSTCTVRSGRLESCEVFGATGALINFSTSDDCIVDDFLVNASGGTTPLAASVVEWTGSCSDTILRNLSIASIVNTEVEPLIDIDTTLAQGVLIENLSINSNAISHIRITGAALNEERTIRINGATLENNEITNASHNINISACGMPVLLDGVWSKSRDTDAYALSAVGSLHVSATDCVFLGERGASVSATNSGAKLTRCKFVGGDESAGSGVQLFRGYGHNGTTYPITPMVLRDCYMEYSAANCNAASGTGTGEPVIFFGGSGGTIAVTHGPIRVDGLEITPGSTVTNQHRDSLVLVDTNNTVQTAMPSSYRNITIDLKEITWSATGAGRGTFVASDAAAFGVNDGTTNITYARPNCEIIGLRILRVKEHTALFDDRSMVAAFGCILRDVEVEGPAVSGTGAFDNPLVHLRGATIAENIRIGLFNAIACSDHVLAVQNNSRCTGGAVRHTSTTIAPGSLVFLDSTFAAYSTMVEKMQFMLGTSVITAILPTSAFAFIESGADHCLFQDNTIEFFGATNSNVSIIRVDGGTNRCAVKYNHLVNGSGSTAKVGVAGAPGTPVDVIRCNSGSDGVQVVGNIIEIGTADVGTTPGANIRMENCSRCLIDGNQVRADSSPALIWINDGDENRVVNNSLRNLGSGATFDSALIFIGGVIAPFSDAANRNVVVGNTLSNATAANDSIFVYGDRNVIMSNIFGQTGCFIIIADATADENIVLGNQNATLLDAGTGTWPDAAINSPATGNNV